MVEFKASVRFLNKEYSPPLGNVSSSEFKELKNRVEEILTNLFKDLLNFVGVIVDGFSRGSVIANYSVFFSDTASTSEAELTERLKEANGTEALDGLVVTDVQFAKLSPKVESKAESSDPLPGWAVALIVIVCLVFLALVIVLVIILLVSARILRRAYILCFPFY